MAAYTGGDRPEAPSWGFQELTAVTRPHRGHRLGLLVKAAMLEWLATGAIPAGAAGSEARQLGPVIGFLAAILVLAHLCDDDGLFRACGAWMARSSAGHPGEQCPAGCSCRCS